MYITIFGCGYVGLVTGVCLAEMGNYVICVDIDEEKIQALNQGHCPIFEPGLTVMLQKNLAAKRLQFTQNIAQAVAHGTIQCIAVGTPPDEEGAADLNDVLQVAEMIGEYMDEYRLVMNRSTVPVGTADKVKQRIEAALQKRQVTYEFDVVSNPEFLKEGAAVEDFMRPDRVVVGTDNARSVEWVRELYAPFTRNHERLIVMDIRSAELTKYAANALLATKISFMNEMANIAEKVGADIEKVRVGIGSDPRIGFHFIYPGVGFGGSCFPKDVKALAKTARDVGVEPRILEAVRTVNTHQQRVLFHKIVCHFQNNLTGRRFALWGLAFKPETDDMREAPSRVLMELLWEAGAVVQAYDPEALRKAQRLYPNQPQLQLFNSPETVLQEADALIIVTEWRMFRSPDFSLIKNRLKQPLIFDGRNLYDPNKMKKEGFTYYAIGRGEGDGHCHLVKD